MYNATAAIVKRIPLTFWTCYFLDSEDGTYPTREPGVVYECRSQGKYLTASDNVGHALCILLAVLIYAVGLFGFVTNIVNVLVLRRSLKGSSLKGLLVILAVFELLACVLCIVFSTAILVILENANRGELAFGMLKLGHVLFSLGRTISIYITILVTVERYLVVTFPVQSKDWLSPLKSWIYLISVTIFAGMLDLPWVFNTAVGPNKLDFVLPHTTLAKFPYVLDGTEFSKNIYPKIRYPQLVLNYVAPFPLLLIFNGLLYHSIYKWNRSRQALTSSQKNEMSTAKMFSVVVLILLLCHSVSCVIVFAAQVQGTIFRELMLLQVLSVTVSAAVNFLVYYKFGRSFREEFAKVKAGCMPSFLQRKPDASQEAPTQTSGETNSENGSSNGDHK